MTFFRSSYSVSVPVKRYKFLQLNVFLLASTLCKMSVQMIIPYLKSFLMLFIKEKLRTFLNLKKITPLDRCSLHRFECL